MLTPFFNDLPNGWVWTQVGHVINKVSVSGKKVKKRDYQASGKLPVIDQGLSFIGGYTDNENLRVECQLPIIVFGDHTKTIKYINFDFVAGADGIKVIKPQEMYEPKLFYYFMQAIPLPNKGYARHFQFLEKAPIPLPPLPEQRRIVAKLDALFTQLDAGVDALKQAQAQVKRYRRSLLKAAFEGELTKEWREARLDPLQAESHSSDLPNGWVWTQIKEVAEFIRGVSYRKNESSKTPKTGYLPILRANNINVQLNYEDLVYVQQGRVKAEQFIKAFDIIIAMSSGSKHLVGKAAQAHQDFKGSFGTFCGLVRISSEVNRKFIGLFFQSPIYRNEISRLSLGININNLRREHIETMFVPLPSLPEQRRIVSEVEHHLSIVDEVEATLAAESRRAERLRQSILKHAFSGKLVSQNPDDEPASSLLERMGNQIDRRA